MITSIEIENFKGIGERIQLDLKPITLLFGPNSAGKSTVTHALHYAREVLTRRNYDADKTIAGGDFVDLGGFRTFVHMQNLERMVKLKFCLNLEDVIFPKYFPEVGHLQFEEYVLPQISECVKTGAIEIWISYCPYRKTPFVSRYEIELNGEFFAAIESTYERVYADDRTEKYIHNNSLVDLNYSHSISNIAFDNLTKEPLVYSLLGSVFRDSSIPLANLKDALPPWGKALALEIRLPNIDRPGLDQLESVMAKGVDRWVLGNQSANDRTRGDLEPRAPPFPTSRTFSRDNRPRLLSTAFQGREIRCQFIFSTGEKGDSHQIDRRDIHSRSGLRKPSGTDAIVD